jgi:alkanesulfonate monooxygenase SsuD/methylene tetrahydromethanopterin reductase-like flavin-dependent oxidoreductase (luciferase family)
MVVTLDHITTGRAVCGLGAGWAQGEHEVHGIDFGRSPGQRIERLRESAQIVRGLLDGTRVDSKSQWYNLSAVSHAPRPLQAHLPILIGGEGRMKTLQVVAELGDLWNARGGLESLISADAALRDHCLRVGRSPDAIERLTNRWVVIRQDRLSARQFVQESMQYQGLETYDESGLLAGPPELVAEGLVPLVNAGFRHLIWSLRAPWDLETVRRLPEVRELVRAGAHIN